MNSSVKRVKTAFILSPRCLKLDEQLFNYLCVFILAVGGEGVNFRADQPLRICTKQRLVLQALLTSLATFCLHFNVRFSTLKQCNALMNVTQISRM